MSKKVVKNQPINKPAAPSLNPIKHANESITPATAMPGKPYLKKK